jgi:hypothetical protein
LFDTRKISLGHAVSSITLFTIVLLLPARTLKVVGLGTFLYPILINWQHHLIDQSDDIAISLLVACSFLKIIIFSCKRLITNENSDFLIARLTCDNKPALFTSICLIFLITLLASTHFVGLPTNKILKK